MVGLNAVPEENKPETGVDFVARLFIEAVMSGMRAAASSPASSNPKGWKIRDEVG